MLERFTVESVREGQSRALNQQRTSNPVTSIISSDAIGNLPDNTVAEALARLAGVNVVVDGRSAFASIRGSQAKLNSVTLDGSHISSPANDGIFSNAGRETRAVDLSKIPSDMISRIEVIKALPADRDADSFGGLINLVTRSAFDQPGRSINGRAEYRYNSLSKDDGFAFIIPGISHQGISEYDQRYRTSERNSLGGSLNLDFRPNATSQFYLKLFHSGSETAMTRWRLRERGFNTFNATSTDALARGAEARLTRRLERIETDRANDRLAIGGKTNLPEGTLVELAEGVWWGETQQGKRQFKPIDFNHERLGSDAGRAYDTGYHVRVLQPALLLWQRSRDAKIGVPLTRWLRTWAEAAEGNDNGKPSGIVPAALQWPSGRVGSRERGWIGPQLAGDPMAELYSWPGYPVRMMTTALLQAQVQTGEALFLAPLLRMAERRRDHLAAGGRDGPPGSERWAAHRLAGIINEPLAKWRQLTGDDRFDSLLRADANGYVRTQFAPNLAGAVLDSFVRTPLDSERTLPNMRGGDLLIGSFANGQIGWNRPFAGAGQYRTPLPGLYLCGGSTHPGGNVTGLCGYNAARVIAADTGKSIWWQPPDLESRLRDLGGQN